MTKNEFIDSLRLTLKEKGMTNEQVESWIEKANKLYGPDDVISIDEIENMERFVSLSKQAMGKVRPEEVTTEYFSETAQIDSNNENAKESEFEIDSNVTDDSIFIEDDGQDAVWSDYDYSADDEFLDGEDDISIVEEEVLKTLPYTPEYKRFMLKTSPIAFFGFLAYCISFLISTAALWAMVCVSVAGIIGSVVTEIAICVSGIIYSVGQWQNAMPIALFEIGLVVVSIGIAIFLIMGFYYLGFKLLPFLYRNVKEFFYNVLARVKDFYAKHKKECVDRL